MRIRLLWFVLVGICVYCKLDCVYGKPGNDIDKHDSNIGNQSRKDLNTQNNSKKSKTSLHMQNGNVKENTNQSSGLINLSRNVNDGHSMRSKISQSKINRKDRKNSTSKHWDKPLEHANLSATNSSIIKNVNGKDEIRNSNRKNKENVSQKRNDEVSLKQTGEKQKDEQTTKFQEKISNGISNSLEGKDKISVQANKSLQSSKQITKNATNNTKESLIYPSSKDELQKNPNKTKSPSSLQYAKVTIHESSKLKNQSKASLTVNASSPPKTKFKEFYAEKEADMLVDFVKTGNQITSEKKSKLLDPKSTISSDKSQNGKSQTKRAKKLLVTFFHNELDDDEHAEEASEKRTRVLKGNKHAKQDSRVHLANGNTQEQATMHSEISDKLYKRTGLQPYPQVTSPNSKVIETVLPAGPKAATPQHIRLDNQPTHVLFKPVHKYYPAIHRYMTKPIHRYLKKPVDLNGVNSPLEGQEFSSPPQVKGYAAPLGLNHNVGIPQVVSNKVTPQGLASGGFGNSFRMVDTPLQVQQDDSPPEGGQQIGTPQFVQTSVGQQRENSGGSVNDQTRVVQAKQYDGSARPRIVSSNTVPAGLVHGHHIIQGGVTHMGPVRIFTQLPPRIQPVLIHPNRLSTTGFGPCSTNPCKNSGVCSTVNDQAVCICKPGFRGRFCELVNTCHPNPCHNYGSCTENERDFQCTCKKGYRGKRCEVENKCEPNPCINGGTCSEIQDDYVCTCREGFLGHSCEAESKCSPINPCKNGGTCQEARDTYKCFCRDGFGGFNCEARVRRSFCLPNPCQNGGFCTITGTSTGNYTCSCPVGWKGPTCVEKVDNWGNSEGPTICQSVNPCRFGGKCRPISYYDYTCTCPYGRGGAHCEQDLRHPKFVSSCSHCHAFARCLDGHCSCSKGYVGDGMNCEPVQQFCHPNPCYNGGTCRQSTNQKRALSGGKPWWCECPTGYKGLDCQDMDLCLMRLCQNGGSCLSSQGQTKCMCPPAYRGKYCQEKNVCYGNPCKNGGSCTAVEGVATCSCPQEYEGQYCQHWKCSKCDRNAFCDKGSCVCNTDFTGDGMTCRKKISNPPPVGPPASPPVPPPQPLPKPPPPPPAERIKFCSSNPCASGATCLEALETYFCQCPEYKYGKNCDQRPKVIADLCSKCDIDATCRDGRCVCNEGFNGNGFTCKKSTPQTEISTIITPHKTDSSCEFCPENGQCLDNVCVCPPGFENRKRSCVAIDVPRVSNTILAKMIPPGIEYVGKTRNRLPIGQWKEKSVVTEYQSLGCWGDTTNWRNPIMRAITSLEGLHPSLNDDYQKRKNPITKCANAAHAYGYKIFAVQNGGQCFSDPNAGKTYTNYGPSTACRFGVGGQLANDVYKIS